MKNFFEVYSRNPLRQNYMYLDVPEYLADQIFIRHKLSVKFRKREYGHKDTDVRVIFCSVRKDECEVFEQCMDELYNAVLLTEHKDYAKTCEELVQALDDYSAV